MDKSAFYFLLILLVWQLSSLQAQELPRCSDRDYLTVYPRVIGEFWCIENPISASSEWAFTALAISPSGAFYATNPASGELLALEDTNGDRMPDTVAVLASDLSLANGLALEGESLYILGDGSVYRYENGSLSTIADDLPTGRGFMARGIAVQDERIYIGIPYPCDVCAVDNELYGTVLSMDLSGANRQIEARGLRYPAGLSFYEGALWVTDTARDGLSNSEYLDEVNRIALDGTIPHFGFPYCIGLNNSPDIAGDFDCATATAPSFAFLAHSNPIGIDTYEAELFPWIQDSLLLVLGGSFDNSFIRGYALVSINSLEDGQTRSDIILPRDGVIANFNAITTEDTIIPTGYSELLNQRGGGIWPHRLLDVAISPEGWIYSSVGGLGIFVLRPSDNSIEEICRRWRECP